MPTVKGLLIGHGKFPETLLDVVRTIIGEITDFATVSYEVGPSEELEQKIKQTLANLGDGEKIIFVDLYGSSGANICNRLLANIPSVAIICGVNLPMLIKFFRYRHQLDLKELVLLVKKTGQEEIRR
jgi:mannose/fructose-specific phosphotransferase system component IIA|uniref:PTS sugar transporter subunit IIA n=1 Tax=candidate division WOR-3 bacterium TaxID=2052148 RepID=A0A7C6ECE9_UNCW3